MPSTSSIGLRAPACLLAFVLAALVPAHAIHLHRGPTSHSPQRLKKSSAHAKKASKAPKGQRQIDSERATEIQSALIKAGYMSGSPTGQWDAQTTSALVKLQGENGWQTKITPDSRALIKLGLGPDHVASSSGAASAPASHASESTGAGNSVGNSFASN